MVIGHATDGRSIFVRDVENYYHYSFDVNTWSKLKFKEKPIRLTLWDPKSIQGLQTKVYKLALRIKFPMPSTEIPLVYLPAFGKVMVSAQEIEYLDTDAFTLSHLNVEGVVQVSEGIATRGEKVYLFGGMLLTPNSPGSATTSYGIHPSNQFTAFDAATISFEDLPPLPTALQCKGRFIHDELIAVCGTLDDPTNATVMRYDSLGRNWDNLGTIPVAISRTAIASWDDRMLLLGSRGVNGFLGLYHPASRTYSEFPTNVQLTQGAAFVRDNKLYYFGGINVDFPGSIDRSMYVADLGAIQK